MNDEAETRSAEDSTDPAETPSLRVRRRFWTHLLLWLLEGVGGLVALALLCVGILALRLQSGPLELGFLKPELVAWLNTQSDPLAVEIDRTSLNWIAGQSTAELVATGVRVTDLAGITVVSLPKLSVTVALRGVLAGRVEPTRISLIGPKLQILRTAGGSIGVDLGQGTPSAPAEPAAAPPPDSLIALLHGFAGKPQPNDPLRLLNQVSILQASVTVDDRENEVIWHVTDGELDLTRTPDGLSGETSAGLGLGEGATKVSGHVHYDNATDQAQFGLALDGLDPAKWASALPPELAIASEIRLPLSGTLDGRARLFAGRLGDVHFRLVGGAGAVVDPQLAGGQLAVKALNVEADYDPANRRLTLGRLRLDMNGPVLDAHATLDGVQPALAEPSADNLPLTGGLTITGMTMDRLAKTWPDGLAEHAREWIVANLSAGKIDRLDLTATAALEQFPLRLSGITFKGRMGLTGFTVDYLHGLPKLQGVDAQIDFTQDAMDFAVSSGGLLGLHVPQGAIRIDQFDADVQHMTIDVGIQGPVPDVLTVLDQKPLGYARKIGLEPKRTAGTADGTLHLAMPLKRDLGFDEIEYAAKAELADLGVKKAVFDRDVTEGRFSLTLDKSALTLDGTGKLDGVPTEARWVERLGGKLAARSQVHAKAIVDDRARQRFGIDPIPTILHGPAGVDVTYQVFDDHRSRVDATFDLTPSRLTIDTVGWTKAAGVAGRATVGFDMVDGVIGTLAPLKATAGDLDLDATMSLEGGQIRRADLTRLKLGGTDATGSVERAPEGTWVIRGKGPAIDIGPLLKKLGEASPDDKAKDEGPTLAIAASTDHLILGPKREMRGIVFDGLIAHNRLEYGKLDGQLGAKGRASFHLDRIEAGGGFALETDDFGALLTVFDVSENLVGGKFKVGGNAVADGDVRRYAGKAEATDYRVIRAPFMARVLSVASLTSIASLLSGDGLPFAVFKSDFTLKSGRLTLRDAHASGGAIGINADGWVDLDHDLIDLSGTLVPAYTLNSILNNIPLLGDLITGGEGTGLFAANYRLSGSLDDPQINVNPLSALAPGFLRRLFLFDAPASSISDPRVEPPAGEKP
ncbi:MAG TPA: AsmA-like C-terminal domain-containing protein [Aliidongia sp.]|uniref:YhdP family protein n=1 Tax=Aliidongia sp. TaxID=1914230 RepID=UPI002DDD8509|nr:AsmA-like C-terminal domain-containing protein [Aliidongia sp.]HEV2674376.1 AsmA-like C-terminal domain-containing protein [Aliidongia sp.]